MNINSYEYWNNRFNSDWETYNGQEQTIFFINLLLNNLPNWLISNIEELSICDAGCAEGQGTYLINKHFNNSIVEGVDFSDIAIEKAKEYYPNINFRTDDINNLSKSYDVVIISNVLEHFEKPFSIIKKLLLKIKKHLVIMVPFNEVNRLKEHFYTFNYDSFPLKIDNFSLSYFKEIDCRFIDNTLWNGKQAIVVYSNLSTFPNEISLDSIKMDNLNQDYIQKLDMKIEELDNKLKELSNWGKSLENEVKERDKIILDLNQKIVDVSEWGKSLENEVKERDKIILDLNQKIVEVSEWGKSLEKEVKEKR